ncbi:MAG: tyrosine-type recombinase/integrase, partial [Candidatus Poribacteria bacterium]|nr:tyrosine-type recombinase/integrase [Candidatus Poribacteria bacterium]
KAAKTVYNERWMIRSNLAPFFGKTKISRISPAAIERYKSKRHRDDMSPRTINMELQLLSVMFRLAMRLGYAKRNLVRDVERMREVKKPPRYLSTGEVSRLLTAAKETYLHPLIVTALHTGMRKAELFNLTWSDIDFDANTITIQSKEDWQTKNRQYRTVEMTDALRRVLYEERERNGVENPYVFTYGGERLRWTVKKTLRTICRKARVGNVTLHTLRHTFASHLAMQGVPLLHIQQLLGHHDYNTTLIYAHLSSESHKGQVHRLPFDDEDTEPS